MRILDPNATALQKRAYKMQQFGYGVPLIVATVAFGILALPVGLPIVLAVNSGLWWFFIPFVMVMMVWITYGRATLLLPKRDDDNDYAVQHTYPEYEKCIGTYSESVAKPLMLSIIEHAKVGHRGDECHDKNGQNSTLGHLCHACQERKNLIKQLAGQAVQDRSDIEAAETYLASRKELGI